LPEEDGFAVASFSAASQYVDRAIGAGWLAVGDALLGLDPLSSSGIAGALEDARAAVDTIVAWRSARDGAAAAAAARGYAARAEETLRRYLAERHAWYSRERRWAEQPFWARRGA
jgi:flavin-dependent dehydrogenase